MSASDDDLLGRSGSALSSPSSTAFFSADEGDDNALYLSATSIEHPCSDHSSTPTAGAAVASSIGLYPVPKLTLKETPTPSAAPNPLESSVCAGVGNTEPRVFRERSRGDRNDLSSSSPASAWAKRNKDKGIDKNLEPPEPEHLQAKEKLQMGPSTKVPLDQFFEKDSSKTTRSATTPCAISSLSAAPNIVRKETPTPAAPNPLESSACACRVNTGPRLLREESRGDLSDLTTSSRPFASAKRYRDKGIANCFGLPEPEYLQVREKLQIGPSTKVPLDQLFEKDSSKTTPLVTAPCRDSDAICSLSAASDSIAWPRKLPTSITRPTSITKRPPAKGIGRTRRRSIEVPSSTLDDAVTDGYPSNIFEVLKMLLPKEEPSRVYENVDILDIAKEKELDINLTPSWWRPGGYDVEIPKSRKDQSERPS